MTLTTVNSPDEIPNTGFFIHTVSPTGHLCTMAVSATSAHADEDNRIETYAGERHPLEVMTRREIFDRMLPAIYAIHPAAEVYPYLLSLPDPSAAAITDYTSPSAYLTCFTQTPDDPTPYPIWITSVMWSADYINTITGESPFTAILCRGMDNAGSQSRLVYPNGFPVFCGESHPTRPTRFG